MHAMPSAALLRSIAAIATVGCAVSTSLAQGVFVLPHMLEKDGKLVGIGWSPEGSQLTGRPVGQPAAAGLGTHVQRYSPYSNLSLFNLAADNVMGKARSEKFNITFVGKVKSSEAPKTYTLDLRTEFIEFPACDVDSKEPQPFTMGHAHANPIFEDKAGTGINPLFGAQEAKKQKQWLPSNFRIRLGSLDCSRVSKVKEIKVECEYVDVDGDLLPDVVEVKSSRIVFTLPYADSAQFQELFRGTLDGKETVLPLRLEYLDDMGNPLITIEQNVVIWGLGPEHVFLPFDPERNVTVTNEGRDRIRIVPTSQTTG